MGGSKIEKNGAPDDVMAAFEEKWGPYVPHMSGFIVIDILSAEHIYSPADDIGFTEIALKRNNLVKLTALCE